MKIVVGSNNPSKLQAVQLAFAAFFPDKKLEVAGLSTESGVANQPLDQATTLTGAKNRAVRALEASPDAEYGIGIEGGMQQINDTWFSGNFAVVATRSGKVGYGLGPQITVSDTVMERINSGEDLATAMHAIYNITGVGKKGGHLGFITNGSVTRESASRDAVLTALGSIEHEAENAG